MPGDASIVPEIAAFLFDGIVDACSYDGDPAWSSGYIAVVDWSHRYFGDSDVLAMHYSNGVAYIEHLLKSANVNGTALLDLSYPGTICGDW